MYMKKNSIRIKELAEALGLSQGTISIVLNGRGDEMRISKATQKRVLDGANEMGYELGNRARRRQAQCERGDRVAISVFIPYIPDVKIILGRVLYGLHQVLLEENLPIDLLIRPFRFRQLEKCQKFFSSLSCQGAIVLGMSEEEDIPFLMKNTFDIPAILYNHPTEKYSTVSVDDYEAGRKAASIFRARGHERVGLIMPTDLNKSGSLRKMGFLDGCRYLGLTLDPEFVQEEYISTEGGVRAARKFMEQGKPLPTAVFVQISDMAVGAVRTFLQNGIRIPEDMELLSFGGVMEDYTEPAVSSISMPVEEMSAECLRMIWSAVQKNDRRPLTRVMPLSLNFRKTCGGFPEQE